MPAKLAWELILMIRPRRCSSMRGAAAWQQEKRRPSRFTAIISSQSVRLIVCGPQGSEGDSHLRAKDQGVGNAMGATWIDDPLKIGLDECEFRQLDLVVPFEDELVVRISSA